MKELKVCLIGAGFMGKKIAKVIKESPIASLQCIADSDIAEGKSFAKKINSTFYDDYYKMLDKEKLDIVVVATPEHYHKDPVEKAFAAGCHVFLEKPIATTLLDAQQIVNASKKAKKKLMIGFLLRFHTSYSHIKEAIEAGNIGKFIYAYARRMGSINTARRLGKRVTVNEFIAIHDIDQILWYNQVPVKTVSAKALYGKVFEEIGTYDLSVTSIQFEDNTYATIETGWTLPAIITNWSSPNKWQAVPDLRMDILGTAGRLWLGGIPPNLIGLIEQGLRFPDVMLWPEVNGKTVGALKTELEHFFECVLYDREPLATGDQALESLKVLLAAERSIKEKKEINISSI